MDQTTELLLTGERDAAGAKGFFRRALGAVGNPIPRGVHVAKNPAYPAAVDALQAEGLLPSRGRLRQCQYLNHIVEQDHRAIQKRFGLAKGTAPFRVPGGLCQESQRGAGSTRYE